MISNSEIMYWHRNEEYFHYDREKKEFVIHEDAPQRVKDSFKLWQDFQIHHGT